MAPRWWLGMRRITSVRVVGSRYGAAEGPPEVTGGKFTPVPGDATAPALTLLPPWVGDAFWARYRVFLGVTALVHLLSAVATSTLIYVKSADWPTRICASYVVWKPANEGFKCFTTVYNASGVLSAVPSANATSSLNVCNRFTAWRHVGSMDPSWMSASFFFISFAFQALPILPTVPWFPMNYDRYKRWLLEGTQPLRFVEYSVSSTVMIMVIALITGTTDFWIILPLAACNWCIMVFGLFHEQVTRLRALAGERVGFAQYMAIHAAGWVPFVVVWAVLTAQFEWSLAGAKGVPAAVQAIPIVNLVLFCTFGVNQFAGSLHLQPPALGPVEAPLETPTPDFAKPLARAADSPPRFVWTYMHSEVTYTVLSLTTKSLLAWMMYGGSLGQDPSKLVTHTLC